MEPTRFVKSGDVDLAVYTWGEARKGGPAPVVLVHGYPDSALVWEKVAAVLAEQRQVIAYDVRGAGRSSAPQEQAAYDIELLVEDLSAVVDAVSPDRAVHLACHDWGSIALWEAVTTERMKGRLLSYTSMSGPSLDHAAHWIRQNLASGSPAKIADVLRQVAGSWYIIAFQLPLLGPLTWTAGFDRLWPSFLKRTEGTVAEASPTQRKDGATGVNLYRANFIKRLLRPQERRTELPVQVIVARRDRFMTPQVLDGLTQWVPQLWRRDIDAGHWLPLGQPQRIAAWVEEFIGFVDGGDETAALRRARVQPGNAGGKHRGKLAVVTGAGSGFGRETLLALAEQGADVIAVDIDLLAAERSAELAQLLGAQAWARRTDVGSASEMESLASWIAAEFGAPDIVVNNAGIGMAGAFLDTTVADWERVLRVNLWGVIHGSRLFARQMVAAGKRGHIVNVASAAAFTPSRTLPAYATTKAAVRMLSDCLRAELASQRIAVTTICPGIVDTGITQRTTFVGASTEEQTKKRERASTLYRRRNLKPVTVAKAILAALDSKVDEVPVGVEAHAMKLLGRLLPAAARRLARLDLTP